MAQRITGALIRAPNLIEETSIFSEYSQLHGVAQDESTETGRQQRENFTDPKWKNYDFTMFWSRITASHGIAVKWFLRVYWLLPLSIVDSFAEHRRFFCRAQDPPVFVKINGHIGHVEIGWFVGPCKDMCLCYWITGINETESLPWLALSLYNDSRNKITLLRRLGKLTFLK